MYDLASPASHVGPNSPPTLLFHGEHGSWVPAETIRVMYRKLVDARVPVVYVEFPQTDHAFDLILPQFSPPAQPALYVLDRFLMLMTEQSELGI
jgi:dipeptidyl aminopeptidase/acylaminoacyl peptidase